MMYARWICLTTTLTLLFTGGGLWLEQRLRGEPAALARPTAAQAETIQVLVTGAVAKPGLYRLPAGSLQQNLLDLAGGPTPDALPDSLQPSRPLQPGEVLNVPARPESANFEPGGEAVSRYEAEGPSERSRYEAKGPSERSRYEPKPRGKSSKTSKRSKSSKSASSKSASGPVSLNRGSVSDFDGLPGVGPALAQRIVDWRQAHGGFKAIEDLLEVKGIGPKKLEKMRAQLQL